jgi:hypothetical protein
MVGRVRDFGLSRDDLRVPSPSRLSHVEGTLIEPPDAKAIAPRPVCRENPYDDR